MACSATVDDSPRPVAAASPWTTPSLPVSEALRVAVGDERAFELALTGGEDYELCFTVPSAKLKEFTARCPAAQFWLEPDRGLAGAARGHRAARRFCDAGLASWILTISVD